MNPFDNTVSLQMNQDERAQVEADIALLNASLELFPEEARPTKVTQKRETGEAVLHFSSLEAARTFQAGMDNICGNTHCFQRGIACSSRALFALDRTKHAITTGKTNAIVRVVEGLKEQESPGMTYGNADVAQAFLNGAKTPQEHSASIPPR